MIAYCVYGGQNAGKSTTCFKIYELLVKNSGCILESDMKDVNPTVNSFNDFTALIEFHGKKILITSAGDSYHDLDRNINRALELNPDYFIFSIRKRIRYDRGIVRLQNTINDKVKYFCLETNETNPITTKDEHENQIALEIFNLLS